MKLERDGRSSRAQCRPVTADFAGRREVLYVSGHTNDHVVRTGVLHDAVHFRQKPFAREAIAHKVREILSS